MYKGAPLRSTSVWTSLGRGVAREGGSRHARQGNLIGKGGSGGHFWGSGGPRGGKKGKFSVKNWVGGPGKGNFKGKSGENPGKIPRPGGVRGAIFRGGPGSPGGAKNSRFAYVDVLPLWSKLHRKIHFSKGPEPPAAPRAPPRPPRGPPRPPGGPPPPNPPPPPRPSRPDSVFLRADSPPRCAQPAQTYLGVRRKYSLDLIVFLLVEIMTGRR